MTKIKILYGAFKHDKKAVGLLHALNNLILHVQIADTVPFSAKQNHIIASWTYRYRLIEYYKLQKFKHHYKG